MTNKDVSHITELMHSEEAINFQSTSNLGNRLSEVFRSIIVFVNKNEAKYDMKKIKENEEFIDIIERYATKVIEDSVTKIIVEETGVVIKNIVYISPKQSSGLFAVDILNNNISVTQLMNEMITGHMNDQVQNRSLKENISDLLDTSKYLNLNSGYFDFKKAKTKLRCNLYFDIGTAFIPDLVSYTYKKSDRFKAEELAAIIMHEIGHVISAIEYMAYNGYCGVYGTQFINEKAKITNDPELFVKEIEVSEILKLDNKISKDSKFNKLFVGLNNIVLLPFKLIKDIVSNVVFIILRTYISFIVISIMSIANGLCIFAFIENFLSDKKNIREAKTKRDKFITERLADEYVSRHGFGSFLSEGLKKIFLFFDTSLYSETPAIFNNAIRSSTITRIYLSLLNSIETTLSSNLVKFVNRKYEDKLNRLKRLLENSLVIFKDKNLPAKIRDKYIVDVERIMASIDQRNRDNRSINKLIVRFFEFVKSVVFVPDKLVKIIKGDISKEQEKLLNDIDTIMSNKLYYLSAKLKSNIG